MRRRDLFVGGAFLSLLSLTAPAVAATTFEYWTVSVVYRGPGNKTDHTKVATFLSEGEAMQVFDDMQRGAYRVRMRGVRVVNVLFEGPLIAKVS